MIAIIGAGASGLVAAITASRNNAKVIVFEKNSKIGRKILATGNGRCNVTNKSITSANYHGKNSSFINPSIDRFNTSTCKSFFEELGVLMSEGNDGRLYPRTQQSSSINELLIYECKRLGVEFRLDCEVEQIQKSSCGFTIITQQKPLHVRKVLIATGGLAMPSLGSCDSGYNFAKSFAHSIIDTHASLTQLISKEDLKSISGVKMSANIEVIFNKEVIKSSYGDLLFTTYGVSGSAILDLSRSVTKLLLNHDRVDLKIDLLPEYKKESLTNILQKRLKFSNQKDVAIWLDGFINFKLAKFISNKLNVKNADELNRKHISQIVYALKNFTLTIVDSKGFKSAEVTAGGVDTEQIDAKTMESKLQKGLYFSGEVIDIDGDCGGYNLHWAWSSGYSAGLHMSKL